MTYPNIKTEILSCCLHWAKTRQAALKTKEASLQEALQGANKSSAGDKHNTERAMLQIEREQLGQQLAAISNELKVIGRIDTNVTSSNVHLGSLVYATNAIYFISVSAGVFTVNNIQVVAISSAAPITRQLLGKTIGDNFAWRGENNQILAVY